MNQPIFSDEPTQSAYLTVSNKPLQEAVNLSDMDVSIGTYRDDLKSSARRMIGPRMRERLDSSDLVQETLLVSVTKLSDIVGKPQKVVFQWMIGVMKHRVQHHAREIYNHGTFDQPKFDTPDPRSHDHSVSLLHDELRQRVMNKLTEMSAIEHDVFRMRYYDELSLSEICKRTGRTESSVRGLLFRTVCKLRFTLGESIV